MPKRHVYVLQSGDWDTGEILGVFATPELAMAAWRPATMPLWSLHDDGRWIGKLSTRGEVEVDITRFEVVGA